MTSDMAPRFPFVSCAWLAERLDDPTVRVIDASWHLPTQNRDARSEFLAGHIPGAVFFDLDAIVDPSSNLPHMLPDAATFGAAAGALGLSPEATIVVYDSAGLFSAPRVWWMLRLFGAADVHILDGGLPHWQAEGRDLQAGAASPAAAQFHARRAVNGVAGLDAVREALADGTAQIIDARPAPRFRGDVPEPRPGVRAGHMPGSLNLPFTDIVADGQLKAPEALRQSLGQAGIDLDRPVITSCGSGVSAAILLLALETLGKPGTQLYDGSWAEYGSRTDLPIETGP